MARLPSAHDAGTHDPAATTQTYPRRADAELPFDPSAIGPDVPLMFDATFYIDRQMRKVPQAILDLALARAPLHSAIAVSEITITLGLMDPAHPKTSMNRQPIEALLQAIQVADVVAPSATATIEAGMLAGILARTQLGLAQPQKSLSSEEISCQKGRRRKLLNDALIFLSARENGATLVTRNISDMDLLLRFRPDTKVLFYRAAS